MSKRQRTDLLEHLHGEEERRAGAWALDLAQQSIARDAAVTGHFLDPLQQQVFRSVLQHVPEVSYRFYGGYPKAERKRVLVFPHYTLVELLDAPIEAVEIRVSAAEKLTHRDYLGAILGSGISRDKVGDVIVTASGCQAVVAKEVADYLLAHVTHVSNVRAEVTVIDPDQIEGAYERIKQIKTTVASLRLDAVASAGFGDSRTKMTREIKGERVKLNWAVTKDPAREVKPGDVISMRGRGRVVVAEITGTSRKGRVGVLLERFL